MGGSAGPAVPTSSSSSTTRTFGVSDAHFQTCPYSLITYRNPISGLIQGGTNHGALESLSCLWQKNNTVLTTCSHVPLNTSDLMNSKEVPLNSEMIQKYCAKDSGLFLLLMARILVTAFNCWKLFDEKAQMICQQGFSRQSRCSHQCSASKRSQVGF